MRSLTARSFTSAARGRRLDGSTPRYNEPMSKVTAHLEGLVRLFNLPPRSAEKAVLEAVVNSVQATEDRFGDETPARGKVEVAIVRDRDLLDEPNGRSAAPIVAIEVRDNGVGFDAENFASFLKVGSPRKLKIGGKGVGRLAWLKLCSEVRVASMFEGEKGLRSREFRFTAEDENVDGEDAPADKVQAASKFRTTVRFTKLRETYRRHLPKLLETWASRVANHLLLPILKGSCPRITVVEADGCGRIPVNENFLASALLQQEEAKIEVRDHRLRVTLTRLKRSGEGGSQVLLCANGRTVEEPAITQVVPNLPSTLYDPGNGNDDGPGEFDFVMLVEEDLLDERVNMERTRLDIVDDESSPLYQEEVSRKDLLRAVAPAARRFLEPYLMRVEEANLVRAKNRIRVRHVEFRPLLKYHEADIRALPPGLSDDDFDAALFRIHDRFHEKLRKEAVRLVAEAGVNPFEEGVRETYEKFLDQWN